MCILLRSTKSLPNNHLTTDRRQLSWLMVTYTPIQTLSCASVCQRHDSQNNRRRRLSRLTQGASRASAHYHLGWAIATKVSKIYRRTLQRSKRHYSASEAETGHLSRLSAGLPILAARRTGTGQPDAGSPLETDNRTAHGILNSKMRQKLSKS
jgi:hypothetical protein